MNLRKNFSPEKCHFRPLNHSNRAAQLLNKTANDCATCLAADIKQSNAANSLRQQSPSAPQQRRR
jgi:hypothetical protein